MFLPRQLGHCYLRTLSQTWSLDNDVVKRFIRENQYTSHQAVNELMEILDFRLLCNLLRKMKDVTGPAWLSIIADEAMDVAKNEQLNLSICWVSS